MLQTQIIRWCLGAAGLIATVSSCGSKENGTLSEKSSTLLEASGSLADWPSVAANFKDYQFILLNAETSAALRGVVGESGSFKVSNVPSDGKYYALLLDSQFQFGWTLQLSTNESQNTSNKQLFQFGTSALLGALNMDGKLLRSSQQSHLIPVTNYTFNDTNLNSIPDGFEAVGINQFSTTTNSSGDLDSDSLLDLEEADIDNDGVPNSLDNDVDNDGIDNLFDTDHTQSGTADRLKPTANNPVIRIPRVGFSTLFHEITRNTDGSESTNLWFVFGAKPEQYKEVSVISGSFLSTAQFLNGDAFAGRLFDDGTHGDNLSSDGTWSTVVKLSAGSTPTSNQLIVFSATRTDGSVEEYLQLFGTILHGNLVATATIDATTGTVTAGWTPSGNIATGANLVFWVIVTDSADNNRRIYVSPRQPLSSTSLVIPNDLCQSGKSYKLTVRAIAPTSLGGFPGSVYVSAPVSFTVP